MARYDDRRDNAFLVLWTLAVVAATAMFLSYLAVRVKAVELGYELGDSQAELARLREVERVLELELSAHETPERVDFVGRTLLGMDYPEPDRVISAGALPSEETTGEPKVADGRAADRSGVGAVEETP